MKKTKLKYLFGLSAGLLLIAPTILSSCRPADNDKPPTETKPKILSFKDQQINPTPVTDAEVADVLATSNTPKEKVIKLFRDAAQVDKGVNDISDFQMLGRNRLVQQRDRNF
ncbi:hypothetical protein MG1601_442 [Mycoplasmoides gallisepticum]|uniref:hypothetical protein n=1 Tax=Mycoplasmoides gallisepticum TaxID=2096 RepID=UPI0033641FD6